MSQDLNSIIAQLAEIDSASAKIMQKAQNEKYQYSEMIEQQKKSFADSLQKQNDEEIEKMKISMEQKNKEQIAQYQEECNQNIAKLEQAFLKHQNQWADEIFQNLIKG